MRAPVLALAVLTLALPAAAPAAACSPLSCAPSQFAVGPGLLGYRVAADKPVTVVDLATGSVRFALPDGLVAGTTLVHDDGGRLQWWDMTTGRLTATAAPRGGGVLSGVSQDGSRAVLVAGNRVTIVSPTSERTIVLPAGAWQVDALRGDNLFLIKTLNAGYQIRLAHVRSGEVEAKPVKDPREPGTIWGQPFSRLESPDGTYLFTLYVASNGAAMVHELNLDTARARCIDLPGTGDYLSATSWALALRGRTLWAAGPGYGRVVAIDVGTRRVVRHFSASFPYWRRGFGTRAALSPDGTRLALADGETVAVLSLRQRKVVSRSRAAAAAVGYSPAGRLWIWMLG